MTQRKLIDYIGETDHGAMIQYEMECGHTISLENDLTDSNPISLIGTHWFCLECEDW